MPVPEWLSLDDLPSLMMPARTGVSVADETPQLIEWLQVEVSVSVRPTVDHPRPMQPWSRAALPAPAKERLQALVERHGAPLLDRWAAALLRAWLEKIGSGTARRFQWVVPAAGLLGGDACALLLGPHLRGKNHALRCTGDIGVAALIEMNTRGAWLELAHLAAKCPGRIRGQLAHEALQALAAARGLTPEQFQDRILPECGLDSRGERIFDYGPRQFRFGLDEYLQPVLRSSDGRQMTALPKPTAKDDAEKASCARIEWKTAKAIILQTARSLARRFEGAMISGESWSAPEFTLCFQKHPLARHVIQRILWTTTATAPQSPLRFRIAEDDTLADATDRPLSFPAAATGLRPVHPMELEAAELASWQQIFSDYRIISPFPQLDRPTFQFTPAQESHRVLTAFPHPQVAASALVFPLETRGWTRDDGLDGGVFQQHQRRFTSAGVVACLSYEPGAFVGDIPGSPLQHLQQLFFVAEAATPLPKHALPLAQVPVIIRSEVLRDLHALVPPP